MANVYLPYGYPVLSGTFDTVVVQGTVARLYVLQEDPRTENQLFQRKIFSDVGKMRGEFGKWAKESLKRGLGKDWTQIITQLVKGDVFEYWSGAFELWDDLSPTEKQTWRDVAPYLATYNDPGEVWFRLARVIWSWLEYQGENKWYMPEPDAGSSSGLLKWWASNLDGLRYFRTDIESAIVDDGDPAMIYTGDWTLEADASYGGGTVRKTSTPGDYVEVVLDASQVLFVYRRRTDGSTFKVFVDGAEAASLDSNGAAGGLNWFDVWRVMGPKTYKVLHTGSAGQVLAVDYFSQTLTFHFADMEAVVGSWVVVSTIAELTYKVYRSDVGAGGSASFEFNFVGSYVHLFGVTGSIYGRLGVYVDGVKLGEIDQFEATPGTYVEIFGRVRYGLHRCKVVKESDGEINIQAIRMTKKKAG